MNTQNNPGVVATALVLVALAVMVFIQSNRFLKQQAVGACINSGVEEYSYPEDNTKSTTPNMAAYRDCMKEMGYTLGE